MIIFDLDGTLADCEHRRHFVDPKKNKDFSPKDVVDPTNEINALWKPTYLHKTTFLEWKPDWQAFYEGCDQDKPIESVISIWNDQISLGAMGNHMIWSGRCESVREKTEKWLDKHLLCFESDQLIMRPVGNTEPDEVLKERLLDEAIAQGKTIDFVFDDRPKVVRMWRRKGIFVFNCCQDDEEF